MAEHVEVRKLVTYLDENQQPVDKRKRATVIDGVLAFTDDGYIVHVPTGFNVNPPKDADGLYREDLDDRKFITWMLDQDPGAWASSRSYKIGEPLTTALRERLRVTRDSFAG